jgi:psiF repeat
MRFSLLAKSLLLATISAGPVLAAGDSQSPGEGPNQDALEQQKAANCDADASAKSLQGEARDRFMGQCLKGSTAGTAVKVAPTKEQACMTQADDQKLAGPARSSFMQQCASR